MILRVTNAIKNGEMVLPTIGYAVKAGVQLTISDEKFYNNDIQAALRRGLVEIVNKEGHEDSEFAKKILIRNISGKPLGLDNISLLVNEESYISEKEYQSTNVQTAINTGMIEADLPLRKEAKKAKSNTKASKENLKKQAKQEKTTPKAKPPKIERQNVTESMLDRLKKIAAEVDPEEADFVDQEEEDLIEQAEEAKRIKDSIAREKKNASATKMQSWNPHEGRMMDKAESSGKVCKVVSSQVVKKRTVNDDGVMVGDVDFTDQGVKTAKKVSSKSNKAKSSIKPVGRARTESEDSDDSLILDTSEDTDISFVDREQKIERMLSRPDLIRRKSMRQNQEIE